MHSSSFKLNDAKLKSKNVLIVGCSHSGADIASHLVDHASSVTNIFNRPYIITRRFIRFKSESIQNKPNVFHILPVDQFLNTRSFRAPKHLTKAEKKEYYNNLLSLLNLEQTNKDKSHPELYFNTEKESPRVAISDNYYGFVKEGKIEPRKTAIKRFEKDGVVFSKKFFFFKNF